MLLIDRYLLRQFLMVFAICFCSLAGLYIVADALGHLEEFLSNAKKHGGLAETMAEYYGYRIISFFDRTSGILALLAAMFTLAWFQRHNEMTAVLSAGIGKRRIVKPIVLAVAAISLIATLGREIVIPQFRDKFSRTAQDLSDDATKKLEPRYDTKTGVLIRGRQLLTNQKKIEDPSFVLPRELSHYDGKIVAEVATYQPATQDRSAGFLFEDVSRPDDLLRRPSLQLGDEPVLLMPHDTAWLQPNQCFLVSGVQFDQLVDAASWRQYSSTWDLIAGLYNRSLDFGADVRVIIHTRVLQPVLDVTLLMLGMPLMLRKGNRNVFVAIGLALAVVVGFMLVVLGFQYLGSSMLIKPVFAVWAPLFVFVPLAAWISEPVWE